MNDRIIEKIIKKLPPESAKYAVRDITLLTSSIFGQTHFDSFKNIFKADFSVVFWFIRKDGNAVFHRSGLEYERMSKKIGDAFIRNPKKAKEVTNKLVEMSDEINDFLKTSNKLENLVNSWKYFSKLYMDFFAYHQAVFWPSEYLLGLSVKGEKKKKINKIIKILDSAYKYNERVIPNVEMYFKKLGIGHLAFDEIDDQVIKNIKSKSKKRSVLFFDTRMHILSFKEAAVIDKAITEEYKKYLNNLKEIKGLAASPGIVRGKVKLVKDLNKLREVAKGDILVVTQTRPQYNTLIKKVSSIVTDEGGLLSHASMLAREFKIPCIVGTKNASHLLKNGDLVEVDANKGIVKILKRK